jgi:hypothetical protein
MQPLTTKEYTLPLWRTSLTSCRRLNPETPAPSNFALPDRPPLLLLLATIDLFVGIAVVLILYNAAPYPGSKTTSASMSFGTEIILSRQV